MKVPMYPMMQSVFGIKIDLTDDLVRTIYHFYTNSPLLPEHVSGLNKRPSVNKKTFRERTLSAKRL